MRGPLTYKEIYTAELSTVGRGTALWHPAPYRDNAGNFESVDLADVGYLYSGRFVKIFNAADLPSSSTPANHLPYPREHVDDCITTHSEEQNFSSKSVKATLVNMAVGGNDQPMNTQLAVELECRSETGAALLLPGRLGGGVVSTDLRYRHAYSEYCFRHIESWFAVAQQVAAKDLSLRDLIFVTGIDKVHDWSLFSFQTKVTTCTVNLTAGGEGGSSGMNVGSLNSAEQAPITNFGPTIRAQATDAQTAVPADQCVFIRRLKFHSRKEQMRWWLRSKFVQGAGGHSDGSGKDVSKDGRGTGGTDNQGRNGGNEENTGGAGATGDSPGDDLGVVLDNGDHSEMYGVGASDMDLTAADGLEDMLVGCFPADLGVTSESTTHDIVQSEDSDNDPLDSEPFDPLDLLLDYILRACPQARWCCAQDTDLLPYAMVLHDHAVFPKHLDTVKPAITLGPNGLAHLAIAQDHDSQPPQLTPNPVSETLSLKGNDNETFSPISIDGNTKQQRPVPLSVPTSSWVDNITAALPGVLKEFPPLPHIGSPEIPRLRSSAYTTFSPFTWGRRGKIESATRPTQIDGHSSEQSMRALIDSLAPPSILSTASIPNARLLAVAISAEGSLPGIITMIPLLSSLLTAENLPSLRAAGFDILAALCVRGASSLSTTDRLAYLSLFRLASSAWSHEVWRPWLNALTALITPLDQHAHPPERSLTIVKDYLKSTFMGLLENPSMPSSEREERERTIEALDECLTEQIATADKFGLLSDQDIVSLFDFYAQLTDCAQQMRATSIPFGHQPEPTKPQPATVNCHRRNTSSLPFLVPPPTRLMQQIPPKHPSHLITYIYLKQLDSQFARLPVSCLPSVMATLLRGLASYMSPLPTVSLSSSHPVAEDEYLSLEKRIFNAIAALLHGPHSTTCSRLLNQYLLEHATDSGEFYCNNSLGAHRALRLQVRRTFEDRVPVFDVSRDPHKTAMRLGTPMTQLTEADAFFKYQRGWNKEGVGEWDIRMHRSLCVRSLRTWIAWPCRASSGCSSVESNIATTRERILEEIAGISKDILQEADDRAEDRSDDNYDEQMGMAEDILHEFVRYIQSLKSDKGLPILIPLMRPLSAPTPLLRTLAALLAPDKFHTPSPTPSSSLDTLNDHEQRKSSHFGIYHILPGILLSIVDHLSDSDTSKIVGMMLELQQLSPISTDWTKNWEKLLGCSALFTNDRALTRRSVMTTVQSVYSSIREFPAYRRPLADVIVGFWSRSSHLTRDGADTSVIWRVVSDEAVLRSLEDDDQKGIEERESPCRSGGEHVVRIVDKLAEFASLAEYSNYNVQSLSLPPSSPEMRSPSVKSARPIPLDSPPPVIRNEFKEHFNGTDARSFNPPVEHAIRSLSPHQVSGGTSDSLPIPNSVMATLCLVDIFIQLSFTDTLNENHVKTAVQVYERLLSLLRNAHATPVRLTVLQFMMRLRADRDHHVYLEGEHGSLTAHTPPLAPPMDQPRDRSPHTQPRAATRPKSSCGPAKPARPSEYLWSIPDKPLFSLSNAGKSSLGLLSYDSREPILEAILPVCDYLRVIIDIISAEGTWSVLAHVLTHLPAQLANKHFWCGPKTQEAIGELLHHCCVSISNNEFGRCIQPEERLHGLKPRDVKGMLYHTLMVLISYNKTFDYKARHTLVEVFQAGLSSMATTAKCCLHALSLAAFELPQSMIKCLPRILEKLSQIMTNPSMAVHILNFLSIVGSQPRLYANFTDNDFKVVFAVALQYLQHHNRPETLSQISFGLSQHVRLLSYYLLYIWFLAVKLPSRPRHVKFIGRQLLLANEGKDTVDEPTEVCFDWLARYTYANADPRPAPSLLSEKACGSMPNEHVEGSVPAQEKSWVVGYSIATIRTLSKDGWLEIVSRRACGMTKFLCKIEGIPAALRQNMDPEMTRILSACVDNSIPDTANLHPDARSSETSAGRIAQYALVDSPLGVQSSASHVATNPSITASKSRAQNRIDMDPSFFPMQLAPEPHTQRGNPRGELIHDQPLLTRQLRTLDRIPVIDTHKVGILYVAPGQTGEVDILGNMSGSPAYIRFLERLGRLIKLRGQADVYVGGLDPDEDGEYAYAWWDDIGQILYHTATMMPSNPQDERCNNKKRHIGNDYVRIVWNDSGMPFKFDTLTTEFQFVNIVIEPHSRGSIAAYSNDLHENEYFRVTVQHAEGMVEFTPVGDFKIVSAESLSPLVRQLSLLADWYASVFQHTARDTERNEFVTNWHARLQNIKRFIAVVSSNAEPSSCEPGTGGLTKPFNFTMH